MARILSTVLSFAILAGNLFLPRALFDCRVTGEQDLSGCCCEFATCDADRCCPERPAPERPGVCPGCCAISVESASVHPEAALKNGAGGDVATAGSTGGPNGTIDFLHESLSLPHFDCSPRASARPLYRLDCALLL
jgi:hypothetical protein